MLELKGYMIKKSIIVDGGTVKIIRKGTIFAAEREKSIPINNITGVEVKKPGPFVNGFIQIQTAGQMSPKSNFRLSGGTYDAVNDENSVVFTGEENYQIALNIKNYIENYQQNNNTNNLNQISAADELMKFKKLLDDGIITQDEFDSKKKQLLNS